MPNKRYKTVLTNLPDGEQVSVRIPMSTYEHQRKSGVNRVLANKWGKFFQNAVFLVMGISLMLPEGTIKWLLIALGLASLAMMTVHLVRSCYYQLQIKKVQEYVQLKVLNGEYERIP